MVFAKLLHDSATATQVKFGEHDLAFPLLLETRT